MGRKSAAEMEQKVETLRRITGGKPFSTRDSYCDIGSQLGYTSRQGFSFFLKSLVDGKGQCGRQLTKVGFYNYAWVNPSKGMGLEPVKPASSPHVAKDITPDEAVALEVVKEITTQSQDGAIRLVPNMLALNSEEFLDFMEKLESVKVVAKIGTNGQLTGGHVWGLVRNKFHDFYQIAQAVRSDQYEFPPEPPQIRPPETKPSAPTPPSGAEKQLVALCQATAKDLGKGREQIKKLEEELISARAKHSEDERRYKVFCSELDKLRHPAKPSVR